MVLSPTDNIKKAKKFALLKKSDFGFLKKWCVKVENLRENDVVTEMDDNLPRGVWRLMRVNNHLELCELSQESRH